MFDAKFNRGQIDVSGRGYENGAKINNSSYPAFKSTTDDINMAAIVRTNH